MELALYAWVALTDEVILTSDWPLKNDWLGRPLQLQLFNSFSAGEDFFVKVEQLRPQVATPGKADALTVYYLALAFGFKGKHDDLQGMETLKALTQGLATELGAARRRKDDALSPRWKPLDGKSDASSEVPVRLVAVAGLLLLLLLYVGVTAALSAATSAALAGGG